MQAEKLLFFISYKIVQVEGELIYSNLTHKRLLYERMPVSEFTVGRISICPDAPIGYLLQLLSLRGKSTLENKLSVLHFGTNSVKVCVVSPDSVDIYQTLSAHSIRELTYQY